MGRSLKTLLAAALACALVGPARASGAGELAPWYIDQFGGERADLNALYDGRLGIVMMRAPRPQLFIVWRLLHGQRVGRGAGAALSLPCCDAPEPPYGADRPPTGVDAWLAARKLVPGAPALPNIATERDGPNYTSVPNCFPEAFDTAAATLKARAAANGAESPTVGVWLTRQDAVFKACHDVDATWPKNATGDADWLVRDAAYQRAALALYAGENLEAAERFAAIAEDARSPWRGTGRYLQARALAREARINPSAAAYARADAALSKVSAAPAGTFGRGQASDLARALEFREHPARLLATLLIELGRPDLRADAAGAFRDVSDLSDKAAARPEVMDWIATLKSDPGEVAVSPDAAADAFANARAREEARRAGLRHAVDRWTAGRDVAWLVAALQLANAGELPANMLDAASASPSTSPAWLSLRHDLIRLKLAASTPDVATLRAELDGLLARTDLSASDRNVFLAQRLQVSADLVDFARYALRHRLCAGGDDATGCVRYHWYGDAYQPGGLFDGEGEKGALGFGEDARALIDRMPLAERMKLVVDGSLPEKLRLDIALTNFARAVQLKDDPAATRLADQLKALLPVMSAEFASIATAPTEADRRFAIYLVMAKIPGLRIDLVDYTRPEGARVADFQQYWTDWIVLAKPDPSLRPKPLAAYQAAGFGTVDTSPDSATDLSCLGECGRGAAPLHAPEFTKPQDRVTLTERAYFYRTERPYDTPELPTPVGSTAIWDFMLDYLAAHPKDPRAPEALYWLVHVGRFGGSHDHSGHRAFIQLHRLYPTSVWAKKAKYYYD